MTRNAKAAYNPKRMYPYTANIPSSLGKIVNTHKKPEIIRHVKPRPHSWNGFFLDEKYFSKQ